MNVTPEQLLSLFISGSESVEPNNEVAGRMQQVFPRYADPDDGVVKAAPALVIDAMKEELLAGAPRYIRSSFSPRGAIIKAPHIDSPYMDGRIERGFQRPEIPRPSIQLFPIRGV